MDPVRKTVAIHERAKTQLDILCAQAQEMITDMLDIIIERFDNDYIICPECHGIRKRGTGKCHCQGE